MRQLVQSMVVSTYDVEIARCQEQIRDLLAQRFLIDRQVAALQLMLAGLLKLQGTPELSSRKISVGDLMRNISPAIIDGLADQCRRIIRSAEGSPVTAREVKRHLDQIGFDFSGYKTNPLSSIHTTLKRIADGKEFQSVRIRGKGVAYKWLRPSD